MTMQTVTDRVIYFEVLAERQEHFAKEAEKVLAQYTNRVFSDAGFVTFTGLLAAWDACRTLRAHEEDGTLRRTPTGRHCSDLLAEFKDERGLK